MVRDVVRRWAPMRSLRGADDVGCPSSSKDQGGQIRFGDSKQIGGPVDADQPKLMTIPRYFGPCREMCVMSE